MLAHVAAFRVGATVIHADRPVVDKFCRLYQATSLQDLDAAVGVQVQLQLLLFDSVLSYAPAFS